jgi:hypothetical protein
MPVDFPLLTAVGTTAMSVAVADAVASLSMGAVKGATHGVSLKRRVVFMVIPDDSMPLSL